MPALSSVNQKKLLELARQTLEHNLKTGDLPSFHSDDPELASHHGCFVTIYQAGSLRGCVGTFDDSEELYRNVIRMAQAAAFRDTRFPPLAKEELNQIHLEILVLDKPEKVPSTEDIEIGKHGVLVRYGVKSGTYLPSVAVHERWNSLEFVTHCAREKAGLSPSECAEAEVYRYTVEKIAE